MVVWNFEINLLFCYKNVGNTLSLLKNSIAELYEEEKRRNILSNDLNSHNFDSVGELLFFFREGKGCAGNDDRMKGASR